MKIVSIVGARPQFIKAAVISRVLRQEHTEILVHTGQHYDTNMSAVFFAELEIPEPEYNLNIGSGTHGTQTSKMLIGIEQVLMEESPDWVLVYGDTNSTLAGALAAVKLHIPVAHVEAGLRSFNRRMPEEINRVLADHISSLLLCPSKTAVDNLAREGITKNVHMVGDVMYDALLYAAKQARDKSTILKQLQLTPKAYLLATVHRASNTDDESRLRNIFKALEMIEEPVILPVHPRTRKALQRIKYLPTTVRLIEPLGYLDMIQLEQSARMIITDSGGVQKEAYWLSVPCVTLREDTEWPETVEVGWNILVGAKQEKILSAVQNFSLPPSHPTLYGDGKAAEKCVSLLETSQVSFRS